MQMTREIGIEKQRIVHRPSQEKEEEEVSTR